MKDLPTIAAEDYVVGEKTDGIRYIMVCAHWDLPHNKGPFAVLIDRALDMYEIRIRAEDKIFFGTVLDGEMVGTPDGSLLYSVFDIVADRGISVVKCNLNERRSRLYDLLRNDSPRIKSDEESVNLTIYQKNFVPLDYLLQNGMNADPRRYVQHKSDGWIFMPVNCPVFTNRHDKMFKFKEDHTIDLKIIQTDRHKYGLAYVNSGESTFGPFSDPSEPTTMIELVLSKDWIKDIQTPQIGGLNLNQIYEFSISLNETSYDDQGKKTIYVCCQLIRSRTDKSQPNDLFTIQKTIINLRENLTSPRLLEELYQLKKSFSSL